MLNLIKSTVFYKNRNKNEFYMLEVAVTIVFLINKIEQIVNKKIRSKKILSKYWIKYIFGKLTKYVVQRK